MEFSENYLNNNKLSIDNSYFISPNKKNENFKEISLIVDLKINI